MRWGILPVIKGGGEDSSFWGLSQTGKNARTAVKDNAAWSQQQADTQLAHGASDRNVGWDRNNDAWGAWQNRAQQGIGTTGQLRGYGQDIMPGVQEAIDARKRLLAQQQQNWANNPYTAENTMGKVYGTLDQMGANVGQNWDFNQGVIDQGYGGLAKRATDANTEMIDSIKGTYGSARSGFNDAYDTLRGNAAGVYGGLEGELEGTTAAQQKNLEVLKPGTEAFMARTARSYAPMMSNTMARLRGAGVDPNSVQASGMLAAAESERARGIDDVAAQGDEKFAAASNSILGNRQAGLERLRGAGLTADTNLGIDQAGMNVKFGLSEGADFRDEITRNLDLQNKITGGRMTDTLGNNSEAFKMSQDVLGSKADAAISERTLGMQDYNTSQGLLDKAMTEEAWGPAALSGQFNVGQNYANTNATAQDRGNVGMSGIAQQDLSRAIQQTLAAQGFSQDAINAQLKLLGIESANAGWGAKMLAAMAQQAARAAAGGM
jgi:hypothetical protein